MNSTVHEPWPPDALWSEREPLPDDDVLAPGTSSLRLGAAASTLLMPLAARAHGDAIFARQALGDTQALPTLKALEVDVSHCLADRSRVYGVLARTQVFRDLGLRFFERSPRSIGVNLGAGLSHYFQWLDRGTNHWIDADLPKVTALRERLLPRTDEGRMNVAVDLTQPGWWQRLALPSGRHEPPVLVLCEGVLMYLEPAQVQAVLREIGQHAPPGSRLLLDAMCWLAVGREQRPPTRRHRSERHTGAPFRWGPRNWSELTAPHPRLRLDRRHSVMESYGLPYSLLGPLFHAACAVPFYAIADIGVDA